MVCSFLLRHPIHVVSLEGPRVRLGSSLLDPAVLDVFRLRCGASIGTGPEKHLKITTTNLCDGHKTPTYDVSPLHHCVHLQKLGAYRERVMEVLGNAFWGCCGSRKRASEIAKNGLLQLLRKVNLEPACALTKSTHTPVSLSHPITRHPFVRPAPRYLESWWKFARGAFASLHWLVQKDLG